MQNLNKFNPKNQKREKKEDHCITYLTTSRLELEIQKNGKSSSHMNKQNKYAYHTFTVWDRKMSTVYGRAAGGVRVKSAKGAGGQECQII